MRSFGSGSETAAGPPDSAAITEPEHGEGNGGGQGRPSMAVRTAAVRQNSLGAERETA